MVQGQEMHCHRKGTPDRNQPCRHEHVTTQAFRRRTQKEMLGDQPPDEPVIRRIPARHAHTGGVDPEILPLRAEKHELDIRISGERLTDEGCEKRGQAGLAARLLAKERNGNFH